jgi:hypothetical protein
MQNGPGHREHLPMTAAERRFQNFIRASREFGCDDTGERFREAIIELIHARRMAGTNANDGGSGVP